MAKDQTFSNGTPPPNPFSLVGPSKTFLSGAKKWKSCEKCDKGWLKRQKIAAVHRVKFWKSENPFVFFSSAFLKSVFWQMCISQNPALLQCTDLHSAELHLLVFFHLTSICPDSVGQRRRQQEQGEDKEVNFCFLFSTVPFSPPWVSLASSSSMPSTSTSSSTLTSSSPPSWTAKTTTKKLIFSFCYLHPCFPVSL